MKSCVSALFLVVATALSVLGTSSGMEPDKAVTDELKKLEGEWKIVGGEQGGKAIDVKGGALVLKDGKSTVKTPNPKIVFENTFTIDPSKSPKWMDVSNVKTKQNWEGIYELKGDKLRAVFPAGKDGKRPTEFKTKKGSSDVMFIYERVKKK